MCTSHVYSLASVDAQSYKKSPLLRSLPQSCRVSIHHSKFDTLCCPDLFSFVLFFLFAFPSPLYKRPPSPTPTQSIPSQPSPCHGYFIFRDFKTLDSPTLLMTIIPYKWEPALPCNWQLRLHAKFTNQGTQGKGGCSTVVCAK